MARPSDEQITEFLRGLAELTRRTGVEVGGCGCCGSPFLTPLEDECSGYSVSDGLEDLRLEASASHIRRPVMPLPPPPVKGE